MKIFITVILLIFCLNIYAQDRVKINLIIVENNFDEISMKKLSEAIKTLEKVFNSNEFKIAVENEKFKIGNNKLNSTEIFDLIMTGKDNYRNASTDNSIDLRLKMFDEYAGNGNFGFTDMTTRITRTHRCYVQENNVKCYISSRCMCRCDQREQLHIHHVVCSKDINFLRNLMDLRSNY